MRIIERPLCKICNIRKPRRYCPGVVGDICSICCGTEREVTVRCPFECPYLQEARRHEQPPTADPETFPNKDIRVNEQFLYENETLLLMTGSALLKAVLETAGATDSDVREALDAIVRTQRTRQSGLYYDTRPSNPIAASIQELAQENLEEARKQMAAQSGSAHIRDSDLLGIVVFLQRMAIQHNNGRPLGRAFIDFLREFYPHEDKRASSSPLIVT
jgi:hypothetical protein